MASVCSTFELEFISNKYPDPNYVYDSSVSWMCIYFASVGRATLLSGGVGGREGEGGGGGEEDKASVKKRKVDARIEMQFDPWPGSSSSSAYHGTTNDGAEVGSPRAHLT